MEDPAAIYPTAFALGLDLLAARVLARLQSEGIDVILVKGPVVADWLYDDGAERSYVDVDLLVAPEGLPAARRVLADMGIRPENKAVDLLDELRGVGAHPSHAWAILRAGTESTSLGGQPVRVLGVPARLLHLALHAAWHGPATTKPLEDLRRGVERVDEPAWRSAVALARQLSAEPALVAGLELIPSGRALIQTLGLPASTDLRSALGNDGGAPAALRLEDIRRAAGPRAKADAAARVLLPSSAEMRQRYALARRGSRGLAAAHVVRIARRTPQLPVGVARLLLALGRHRSRSR